MQCPEYGLYEVRYSWEVRAVPWRSDNTGTQLLHRKPSLEISKYESVGSLPWHSRQPTENKTNTEERRVNTDTVVGVGMGVAVDINTTHR